MRYQTFLALSLFLFFPVIIEGKEPDPKSELFISPEQVQVRIGQEITYQVKVQGVIDLYGAPFYFYYDSNLLRVAVVKEGYFFKKDHTTTAFLYKVDPEKGRIIIGLSRLGGVKGVSGSGTLVTLTFKSERAGQGMLSLKNAEFKDSRQRALPLASRGAHIDVKEGP